MTKKSKLTFWGAVGTVTGSNFILEIPADASVGGSNGGAATQPHRLMIDCGMFQGGGQSYEKNREKFPYDPSQVQILFVTHAHIDHIGRIPKLVREGFSGRIISTLQTKEIATIMFDDALKLVTEDVKKHGGGEPMYGRTDVEKAISLWESKPYHEMFEVFETKDGASTGTAAGVTCTLLDAGHILGSAMVKLTRKSGGKEGGEDRTIIFSGDIGNSPASIVRDADSIVGANYLILDSTYGDRTHEPREESQKKLAEIVKRVIAEKGLLLIPVFSLERAHIILYELNNMVESGAVPAVPVFLDSPLASRLTPIYEASRNLLNDQTQAHFKRGDDVFSFPKLEIVANMVESVAIEKGPNPKIIIAGSGMSVGGRIPAHEIDLLPNPKTTLLVTGYQSVGTLGRNLAEGQKKVLINNQEVIVRARVESVEGFSAHKDTDGLVEFVEKGQETLKQVFSVHGEPKSCLFLVQRIRDYLGLNAIAPERGEVYEIDF